MYNFYMKDLLRSYILEEYWKPVWGEYHRIYTLL